MQKLSSHGPQTSDFIFKTLEIEFSNDFKKHITKEVT